MNRRLQVPAGYEGAQMRRLVLTAVVAGVSFFASEALADPCKAIPDRGQQPTWVKPGAVFSGQVRHVGDGDSICVGNSPSPTTWVEVRLEDFYAPELSEPGGQQAKTAMSRIAAGRMVACTVTRRGRAVSYDRVVATCRLNGRSLADHMLAAGIREGGRGQ